MAAVLDLRMERKETAVPGSTCIASPPSTPAQHPFVSASDVAPLSARRRQSESSSVCTPVRLHASPPVTPITQDGVQMAQVLVAACEVSADSAASLMASLSTLCSSFVSNLRQKRLEHCLALAEIREALLAATPAAGHESSNKATKALDRWLQANYSELKEPFSRTKKLYLDAQERERWRAHLEEHRAPLHKCLILAHSAWDSHLQHMTVEKRWAWYESFLFADTCTEKRLAVAIDVLSSAPSNTSIQELMRLVDLKCSLQQTAQAEPLPPLPSSLQPPAPSTEQSLQRSTRSRTAQQQQPEAETRSQPAESEEEADEEEADEEEADEEEADEEEKEPTSKVRPKKPHRHGKKPKAQRERKSGGVRPKVASSAAAGCSAARAVRPVLPSPAQPAQQNQVAAPGPLFLVPPQQSPTLYRRLNLLRPLECALPFHPEVRAQLQAHPLLIITPFCSDQLDLLRHFIPAGCSVDLFQSCQKMSLRLINSEQQHHHAQPDDGACHPDRPLPTEFTDAMLLADHPVFEEMERQWKEVKNGQRIDSVQVDPAYLDRCYANNKSFQDLHDSAQQSLRSAFHLSKKHQSFLSYPPASPGAPLDLGQFAAHELSLSGLAADFDFQGVTSEYLYCKRGFAHFNLHVEQEHFDFYHHQLFGDSIWCVIHPDDRHKLHAVMASIIAAQENRAVVERDLLRGRVLLLSKQAFPPLSLLVEHGVRYDLIRLKQGEILLGRGDLAHFGFGVRGDTVALACNVMHADWLLDRGGVQHLHDHFQFVDDLSQDATLRRLYAEEFHADLLFKALNHAPHNHVCGMLTQLVKQLRQWKPTDSERFGATLDDDSKRRDLIVLIDATLDLLHKSTVKEFLEAFYCQEPNQVMCRCRGKRKQPAASVTQREGGDRRSKRTKNQQQESSPAVSASSAAAAAAAVAPSQSQPMDIDAPSEATQEQADAPSADAVTPMLMDADAASGQQEAAAAHAMQTADSAQDAAAPATTQPHEAERKAEELDSAPSATQDELEQEGCSIISASVVQRPVPVAHPVWTSVSAVADYGLPPKWLDTPGDGSCGIWAVVMSLLCMYSGSETELEQCVRWISGARRVREEPSLPARGGEAPCPATASQAVDSINCGSVDWPHLLGLVQHYREAGRSSRLELGARAEALDLNVDERCRRFLRDLVIYVRYLLVRYQAGYNLDSFVHVQQLARRDQWLGTHDLAVLEMILGLEIDLQAPDTRGGWKAERGWGWSEEVPRCPRLPIRIRYVQQRHFQACFQGLHAVVQLRRQQVRQPTANPPFYLLPVSQRRENRKLAAAATGPSSRGSQQSHASSSPAAGDATEMEIDSQQDGAATSSRTESDPAPQAGAADSEPTDSVQPAHEASSSRSPPPSESDAAAEAVDVGAMDPTSVDPTSGTADGAAREKPLLGKLDCSEKAMERVKTGQATAERLLTRLRNSQASLPTGLRPVYKLAPGRNNRCFYESLSACLGISVADLLDILYAYLHPLIHRLEVSQLTLLGLIGKTESQPVTPESQPISIADQQLVISHAISHLSKYRVRCSGTTDWTADEADRLIAVNALQGKVTIVTWMSDPPTPVPAPAQDGPEHLCTIVLHHCSWREYGCQGLDKASLEKLDKQKCAAAQRNHNKSKRRAEPFVMPPPGPDHYNYFAFATSDGQEIPSLPGSVAGEAMRSIEQQILLGLTNEMRMYKCARPESPSTAQPNGQPSRSGPHSSPSSDSSPSAAYASAATSSAASAVSSASAATTSSSSAASRSDSPASASVHSEEY